MILYNKLIKKEVFQLKIEWLLRKVNYYINDYIIK